MINWIENRKIRKENEKQKEIIQSNLDLSIDIHNFKWSEMDEIISKYDNISSELDDLHIKDHYFSIRIKKEKLLERSYVYNINHRALNRYILIYEKQRDSFGFAMPFYIKYARCVNVNVLDRDYLGIIVNVRYVDVNWRQNILEDSNNEQLQKYRNDDNLIKVIREQIEKHKISFK